MTTDLASSSLWFLAWTHSKQSHHCFSLSPSCLLFWPQTHTTAGQLSLSDGRLCIWLLASHPWWFLIAPQGSFICPGFPIHLKPVELYICLLCILRPPRSFAADMVTVPFLLCSLWVTSQCFSIQLGVWLLFIKAASSLPSLISFVAVSRKRTNVNSSKLLRQGTLIRCSAWKQMDFSTKIC